MSEEPPSSSRRPLPFRRPHWSYDFECDGQRYTGGVGRFGDGSVAELFLNARKVGSAAETTAQEAAIVASLALQHGCPISVLRHAVQRKGTFSGPLGQLLELIEKELENLDD